MRSSGDTHRLLFYLHEGFHGNMAGMGSPALYNRTEFGTKDLITNYIQEMVGALKDLEDVPDSEISLQEKLSFYRRAADCFGRSALMLSGAGSLGPFHIGVVKALSEQHLLPSVLSGASAGSIVTAVAGTRHQDELSGMLSTEELVAALTMDDTGGRTGSRVRRQDLVDLVHTIIPDMTFEEAVEER